MALEGKVENVRLIGYQVHPTFPITEFELTNYEHIVVFPMHIDPQIIQGRNVRYEIWDMTSGYGNVFMARLTVLDGKFNGLRYETPVEPPILHGVCSPNNVDGVYRKEKDKAEDGG